MVRMTSPMMTHSWRTSGPGSPGGPLGPGSPSGPGSAYKERNGSMSIHICVCKSQMHSKLDTKLDGTQPRERLSTTEKWNWTKGLLTGSPLSPFGPGGPFGPKSPLPPCFKKMV